MANQSGVVDSDDLNDWKKRFNDALAKPDIVTGPAAADARSWHEPFFGCFTPIDTCMSLHS